MSTPCEPGTIRCYGCGALVKDLPGKPHKYLGASAGCWEVFAEILGKEYGEYGYPDPTHCLTVDAYAVQHPGAPGRQTIQSVNVHLASLYLVLERGLNGPQATQAMGKILQRTRDFTWLEPPSPNGRLTVLDVVIARDLAEHQRLVEAWARDVWQAWAAYHSLVRETVKRTI